MESVLYNSGAYDWNSRLSWFNPSMDPNIGELRGGEMPLGEPNRIRYGALRLADVENVDVKGLRHIGKVVT
jgi:hypothetical protein